MQPQLSILCVFIGSGIIISSGKWVGLIFAGAAIPCCTQYGAGTGDIHLRYVACNGGEDRIANCDYEAATGITNHQQDVRVQCQRR